MKRKYNSYRMLTWDDSYAVALALKACHPGINLEEVSLEMLYRWIIELPEFVDDPQWVDETILLAIYQEWFEEANPI